MSDTDIKEQKINDQKRIDIKKAYQVRKKQQQMFSIVVLVTFFLSIGLLKENSLIIIIPMWIAYAVFTYKNWRCPSCNEALSRRWNPKKCSNCNTILR